MSDTPVSGVPHVTRETFDQAKQWVKRMEQVEQRHTALLDALVALPRHLLWRLADRFQRYERDTDADDAYVRWRDVEDILRQHQEGP